MGITITDNEKAILTEVKLPPRPEVLIRISQEAKKDDPDVLLISDIVSSDVSISAAVLQIVNSAAFARRAKIESIRQAVLILGFRRLFPLIKTVALRTALSRNDALDEVWDIAARVASAAAFVANDLGKTELAENAYMVGLFHVSGIAMMLQHFEGYDGSFKQGNRDGWEHAVEKEREQFGTAHTTIGALLAQHWKLPNALAEVIYIHQDTAGIFESSELNRNALDLLAMLKIARRIVGQMDDSFCVDIEWDNVQDSIMNFYDMDEVGLDALIEAGIENAASGT